MLFLDGKALIGFHTFAILIRLRTGTVNVTNGSTTVTGNQSTEWEPAMNGRTITIGATTMTIDAVTWTATEESQGYSRELTLTEPWAGATASGVRYEIERNTPNWEAMGDFQNQMATYGPIVLDAPPAETVSVTANEGVVRAMLRKSGDTYYLFAVRQTEYGEVVADPGVTFTLSGVTPGTVTVLEESRSLTPSGATISDEFDANEVHIYSFKASGGAPGALTINVEPGTSHAVGRDTWFYATGYQGTDSTFVWDFGDGWTGQGIIPLHRYRFPGVYTVTLTETDASGNEYVATETVTITGTAREVGPKAAGPVVWYKFEGNGNDSSGNDLHGTVTGAAYAAGVSGSCLDTTSGAYMTVGDDDALDGFANGMTISFWAKASDSQLLENVVYKRNSYRAQFQYYSPLYTANAYFYTAGGSAFTRARSSTPFCDGRWRHFLFVYNYGDQNVDSVDPNYMAVYVDGLLHNWAVANGSPNDHTAPGAVAATANDLYIGRNAYWQSTFSRLHRRRDDMGPAAVGR
jgi:hypothetical protein